jgi:uncharacterized membrane protein
MLPRVFRDLHRAPEGVLIATFVLMSQNRMRVQSDTRDDLNLQIDRLAEQELMLRIRMMRRCQTTLGFCPIRVANDPYP